MAKFKGQRTRQQIATEQILRAKIKNVMPEIYACFIITLKEYYKWSDQDIVDCMACSGDVWRGAHLKSIDMIKWCREITGIDCQNLVNEKADTVYEKDNIVYEKVGDAD